MESQMMKPVAMLALILASTSAIRAQQADHYYIQDDNGKIVRVNQGEGEKHYVAQPFDAGRGLPLVTSGEQRASVPPPPIQPFSEEQKRLLTGPAPDPALPVFLPVSHPWMEPASLDPIPSIPKARSSYVDAENVQPCDVVCEREKINGQQQQDFSNGYALGQSFGMDGVLLGQALKHHREQVQVENMDWVPKGKHGEKVINLDNGTAFIVDKKGKMRMVEASLGEQEHILMEQLRKDFEVMTDAYPNDVFTKSDADGARSSWTDLRQAYCSHYRGAKYINLEGREDRCK
jgi:hypothetical protein